MSAIFTSADFAILKFTDKLKKPEGIKCRGLIRSQVWCTAPAEQDELLDYVSEPTLKKPKMPLFAKNVFAGKMGLVFDLISFSIGYKML